MGWQIWKNEEIFVGGRYMPSIKEPCLLSFFSLSLGNTSFELSTALCEIVATIHHPYYICTWSLFLAKAVSLHPSLLLIPRPLIVCCLDILAHASIHTEQWVLSFPRWEWISS
jgi:hypothetical protein